MSTARNQANRGFPCRAEYGAALLLVLIAVGIAAVVAVSFLRGQGTSIAMAQNVTRHAQARRVAESAVAAAISHVQTTATWRDDHLNGVWTTDEPLLGGTFTLTGEDGEDLNNDGVITIPTEGDGDLADDTSDPVTLTATSNFNGTTHTIRAVVTSGGGGGSTFGNDEEYTSGQNNSREIQFATLVTLAEDTTVTAISAYVKGPPPKLLRYAIYSDSSGEPDALIVETDAEAIGSNQYYWHTADVTPTELTAGDYWLALAFEFNVMYFKYESGGQTREKNHDAVANGFLSSWGTSDASPSRKIAIRGESDAGEITVSWDE